VQAEPALKEALIMNVESAALIAHIKSDRVRLSLQFATPRDYTHSIDPERTPGFRFWLDATHKE
jgi:hypothetical protein